LRIPLGGLFGCEVKLLLLPYEEDESVSSGSLGGIAGLDRDRCLVVEGCLEVDGLDVDGPSV